MRCHIPRRIHLYFIEGRRTKRPVFAARVYIYPHINQKPTQLVPTLLPNHSSRDSSPISTFRHVGPNQRRRNTRLSRCRKDEPLRGLDESFRDHHFVAFMSKCDWLEGEDESLDLAEESIRDVLDSGVPCGPKIEIVRGSTGILIKDDAESQQSMVKLFLRRSRR